MAKSKGTVGREGRAVEDRPIPDAPPGITVRRGRGRGGKITGIVVGITKNRQPDPDLEWSDEYGQQSVKEKIVYPKKGKNAEGYEKAFDNIDKVHTVQSRTNPAQVKTAKNAGAYGVHVFESFVEEPNESNDNKPTVRQYSHIEIDRATKQGDAFERSVTYHEYGHSYDAQTESYRDEVVIPMRRKNDDYHRRRFQSENAFRRVEQSGTLEPQPGDSPWDRWAKAVQSSKSYQRMKKLRDSGKGGADLEYYMSPREIFARSYQQYIGVKVDPEANKAKRKEWRERSKSYKEQHGNPYWAGRDFDAVGSAVEDILISRGELREAQESHWDDVYASRRMGSIRRMG